MYIYLLRKIGKVFFLKKKKIALSCTKFAWARAAQSCAKPGAKRLGLGQAWPRRGLGLCIYTHDPIGHGMAPVGAKCDVPQGCAHYMGRGCLGTSQDVDKLLEKFHFGQNFDSGTNPPYLVEENSNGMLNF